MRLESIRIFKKTDGTQIRFVKFNKYGLSLICDDDNEPNQTGSSIGKTAFARCIDICLGARTTKTLYRNSATGTNEKFEQYLKKNKVAIELIIELDENNKCILERNIFDNKEYINGEEYNTINEYWDDLKKIIFPKAPDNISFREMMTKFVRIDSNDMPFKYNGQNTCATVYRYAYFYFLNLYIDENEINYSTELFEKKNDIESFNKKYGINDSKEFLEYKKMKENDLLAAKDKIVQNDYVESFVEVDINNSVLIEKLDVLTDLIQRKKHRVEVLKRSLKKENEKLVSIDANVLRALYDESVNVFKKTNISFSNFISFHNEMCTLRQDAYAREINILEDDIYLYEIDLANLRQEFAKKFTDFKFKVNDESSIFYDNYYQLKQEYSKLCQEYEIYIEYEKRILELNGLLSEIDVKKDNNKNNRNEFNELFKQNSKKLMGNEYSILYNDDLSKFPLSASGVGGQLGTGDTNALLCALDFSFAEFFMIKKRKNPYFIIHDKMETTPLTTLKNIFELAKMNNVQYILPILHDRINELNIKEDDIILHLSKNNKLFKY
jgi:hypothetical protein